MDYILAVDDNPKNIQVLGNLLKNENYKVEFALNGKSALEWLQRREFDLVLLDVMMPEIDGFEVCRRIKRDPVLRHISIIFITARDDEESIVSGFKSGAVDYITKPFKRNELLSRVSTHLELKKAREEIALKNKSITSSINYARRIQQSILPSDEMIKKILPESFVLYKPKEIIGGDFFWIHNIGDKIIVAVADCTGHGVPGSIMSMLGISLLNEIFWKKNMYNADEILRELREKIKLTFYRQDQNFTQRDGMDMALCVIDKKEKQLQYAGALMPLILIRNNDIIEIKGDKQSVALYKEEVDFTAHLINYGPTDLFYLYSDGIINQFRENDSEKFKTRRFKELLLEIHHLPIQNQGKLIEERFEKWRGKRNLLDDVCVFGFSV